MNKKLITYFCAMLTHYIMLYNKLHFFIFILTYSYYLGNNQSSGNSEEKNEIHIQHISCMKHDKAPITVNKQKNSARDYPMFERLLK